MYKLILLSLLNMATLSCVAIPVTTPIVVRADHSFKGGVKIKVLQQMTGDNGFVVHLSFHEYHPEHAVIIQEITYHTLYEDGTEDAGVLVECFRTPTGTFPGYDKHSYYGDGVVSHQRTMRLYTGVTKGTKGTLFFAQLPQNKDGSVLTNIPFSFNMRYQMRYETVGEVIEDDRVNSTKWTLKYVKAANPQLTVTLP